MTLDEAQRAIGSQVFYFHAGANKPPEEGWIKHVNDTYAFVEFKGVTMACYPRDLAMKG